MSSTTVPPALAATTPAVRAPSPWQDVWHRFIADRVALAGLVFLVILVLAALTAPWIVRSVLHQSAFRQRAMDQVQIDGRAVDIVKLRADPPAVHRIVDGDVPDTLVLVVTASDVRIPAELADYVHVLDVQPRAVSLRFGTKATRR